MSNLFIVQHSKQHTQARHQTYIYPKYIQWNEIYAPNHRLSCFALDFSFLSLSLFQHKATTHKPQMSLTPQTHTHNDICGKFLRVYILLKSSATSKNKLYFNMHCALTAQGNFLQPVLFFLKELMF